MREVVVKAHGGFNLVCVAGFEFDEDRSGVSFSFGDWFEDQPPEFRKMILMNIAEFAAQKAEEIKDENVRAN